jgi:branched-subunit amino acid transport protein
MLNNWLLIAILAVTTYLSRLIGLEVMAGRQVSPTLRLYFSYVPAAIIAALIMSQILHTENGHTTVSIPVLAGCLAAAITIRFSKRFLLSVIVGMVIGLLVRYLI